MNGAGIATLFAVDIAAMTLAASLMPLMESAHLPRILLFRPNGTHFMFFMLAVTALGSVQDLSHIGFGGLFHQATLSRCLSRSMFM